MAEVYVVTFGNGARVDGVHGVFAEERRAELACEELQRIYDDPNQWAAVESHEFVTQATEDFEVGGDD